MVQKEMQHNSNVLSVTTIHLCDLTHTCNVSWPYDDPLRQTPFCSCLYMCSRANTVTCYCGCLQSINFSLNALFSSLVNHVTEKEIADPLINPQDNNPFKEKRGCILLQKVCPHHCLQKSTRPDSNLCRYVYSAPLQVVLLFLGIQPLKQQSHTVNAIIYNLVFTCILILLCNSCQFFLLFWLYLTQ